MRFALLSSGQYVAAPLPAWRGESRRVLWGEIAQTLLRHSPQTIINAPSDSAFDSVPDELLAPAVGWTLRTLAGQGVRYTAESFDCENFQRELCQTLAKMAAVAGLRLAPATGGLYAEQRFPYGGTPAGGYHAVCAVWLTRAGLTVVEPQAAGISTPIEAYPNRASIREAAGF